MGRGAAVILGVGRAARPGVAFVPGKAEGMRRSRETMRTGFRLAVALAVLGLAACGAGDRAGGSGGTAGDDAADTTAAREVRDPLPEAPDRSSPPEGTVREDTVRTDPAQTAQDVYGPSIRLPRPRGEEAARLAMAGVELFRDRGCARCHTVGEGYREGPDLGDVALRREYEWIVLMLTEPEYMVQADPDARQLLAEHFEAMPDLELTEEEARAIYAYLVREARSR